MKRSGLTTDAPDPVHLTPAYRRRMRHLQEAARVNWPATPDFVAAEFYWHPGGDPQAR